MIKVTELQGRAQVFTLKDGTPLRIFSRKVKRVAENNISNEMRIAVNMGLISIVPEDVVPKNKKSGGTK